VQETRSRVLVTGALGQIGSELTPLLRERHGDTNVVAADYRSPDDAGLAAFGPFELADVTDRDRVHEVIAAYDIDTIYHMAAILSARGEDDPRRAWDVNVQGLVNVLDAAASRGIRIFVPSSIAVFGPETPRECAPQEVALLPTTMYGVTKVSGELLGEYYVRRFGLDIRGLRYPGIVSSETLPGGGTTDYAVEMFYGAIEQGRYTCFVRPDTVLPMMYMPDCIKATLDLMDADASRLHSHTTSYNVAGMSFSAADLAAAIKEHIPGFVCDYKPDARQEIADSWPQTIDDAAARGEWGWKPVHDLASMTADMLDRLRPRLVAAE